MEKRILIAGSGGQGILFLGKLLVCASMIENREVTWFPSYGAEMRGGTATCTVIVSDEMIGSPVVKNSDYIIVMNDASYNKFLERIVPGGIMVYDSSVVNASNSRDDIQHIAVPASEIAAGLKSKGSANMALIGTLASSSHLVGIDSLLSALSEITPLRRRNMLDTNKKILVKGYSIAQDSKGDYSRYKTDSQIG